MFRKCEALVIARPRAADLCDPVLCIIYENCVGKCLGKIMEGHPFYHNSVYNPAYRYDTPTAPGNIKISVHGLINSPNYQRAKAMAQKLNTHKSSIVGSVTFRGMPQLLWLDYLQKMKRTYGHPIWGVKAPVLVFINDRFFGDDSTLYHWVTNKFDLNLTGDYYAMAITDWKRFVEGTGRPFVWMEITVDDHVLGTLLFELYRDCLPITCDHFMKLIIGTKRGGYKGQPIHRIVKDGWIQGGGNVLKASKIFDEGYFVKHDRRGVLSFSKKTDHVKNNVQFLISVQPAPWMDEKYTAFGQLIAGDETLTYLENLPTKYEEPVPKVLISRCGRYSWKEVYFTPHLETQLMIKDHCNQTVEDINETARFMFDDMFERAMRVKMKELKKKKKIRVCEPVVSDYGDGGEDEEEEEGGHWWERLSQISDKSCRALDHFYYGVPKDVETDDVPSEFDEALYKEGHYYHEEDTKSFLLPPCLRGFRHSELFLNEEDKEQLARDIIMDALQALDKTPAELNVRSALRDLVSNVYDTMKKKKGY